MHLSALKEKLTVAKELAYAKRVEEHKQKCRERKLKRKERNDEMKRQKKRTATAKNMPGCAGNEATAGSSGPQVTVTHKKDGKKAGLAKSRKTGEQSGLEKGNPAENVPTCSTENSATKVPTKKKTIKSGAKSAAAVKEAN